MKANYDTTVARVAGNIIGYLLEMPNELAVSEAVRLARAIVAEVHRTEPPVEPCEIPDPRPVRRS